MKLIAELRLLNLLLEQGDMTARDLIREFKKRERWNENVTMQLIRTCLMNGLIQRTPKFVCSPLMTLEEAKESLIEARRDSECLLCKEKPKNAENHRKFCAMSRSAV